MNQVLDKKYSYLGNFFKTAIEQNRLFHSIILYGSNSYIQYAMAMEIARNLNCLNSAQDDCDCQNCRWIKENKHPAVITVSKIDNKNDDKKTVISEKQINDILNLLAIPSDYHRVFIFCDAEMKKLTDEEKIELDEYKSTGFSLPQESSEEKVWVPKGINIGCFSVVAANSMLKTIEEPPSNVTFIFLTNNKDDLLQTIVSRSQAFYLPDIKNIKYETDFFVKYFSNYPNFDKNSVINFSQDLLNYWQINDIDSLYVLDCIQFYLTQMAKANSNNTVLLNIIYTDIKQIEKSKDMLNSYMKEQTVYENLAFYFSKRG